MQTYPPLPYNRRYEWVMQTGDTYEIALLEVYAVCMLQVHMCDTDRHQLTAKGLHLPSS